MREKKKKEKKDKRDKGKSSSLKEPLSPPGGPLDAQAETTPSPRPTSGPTNKSDTEEVNRPIREGLLMPDLGRPLPDHVSSIKDMSFDTSVDEAASSSISVTPLNMTLETNKTHVFKYISTSTGASGVSVTEVTGDVVFNSEPTDTSSPPGEPETGSTTSSSGSTTKSSTSSGTSNGSKSTSTSDSSTKDLDKSNRVSSSSGASISSYSSKAKESIASSQNVSPAAEQQYIPIDNSEGKSIVLKFIMGGLIGFVGIIAFAYAAKVRREHRKEYLPAAAPSSSNDLSPSDNESATSEYSSDIHSSSAKTTKHANDFRLHHLFAWKAKRLLSSTSEDSSSCPPEKDEHAEIPMNTTTETDAVSEGVQEENQSSTFVPPSTNNSDVENGLYDGYSDIKEQIAKEQEPSNYFGVTIMAKRSTDESDELCNMSALSESPEKIEGSIAAAVVAGEKRTWRKPGKLSFFNLFGRLAAEQREAPVEPAVVVQDPARPVYIEPVVESAKDHQHEKTDDLVSRIIDSNMSITSSDCYITDGESQYMGISDISYRSEPSINSMATVETSNMEVKLKPQKAAVKRESTPSINSIDSHATFAAALLAQRNKVLLSHKDNNSNNNDNSGNNNSNVVKKADEQAKDDMSTTTPVTAMINRMHPTSPSSSTSSSVISLPRQPPPPPITGGDIMSELSNVLKARRRLDSGSEMSQHLVEMEARRKERFYRKNDT
jgi:hypothetical protein